MPEGHTTHALSGRLNKAFGGAVVTLVDASAWGKHLFVEFEVERWLNVHLGLIGAFSVTPRVVGQSDSEVPVRGQVRLRLLNAAWLGDLRAPTVCAVVTGEKVTQIQTRYGQMFTVTSPTWPCAGSCAAPGRWPSS